MLRGIMVSLLFIGLAIYSLGGSTLALFSDTETTSGTFSTGTLDFRYRISQDGGGTWGTWQNGTSARFSVPGLQRGQSGRVIYQLENTGTVNSFLNLGNATVVNYENGCSTSEATVDTTCGNPGVGQGELGAALLVTIMLGNVSVYSGPLNGFSGNYLTNQSLAGNGATQMTVDWSLPSLPGNGTTCRDDDRDDHYNDGYLDGYIKGYYDRHHNSDYHDGYSGEHDNHYRDGYHKGYDDGYHDDDNKCSGSAGADIIAGDSAAVSFSFELVQG